MEIELEVLSRLLEGKLYLQKFELVLSSANFWRRNNSCPFCFSEFVYFHLPNLITITGIVSYPIEKVLLLPNARFDCFALCAAMLSSKQLLWHSTVVVGLKWSLTLSIRFLTINIMP
ncbi:hypothetical protein PN463_20150 [Dolichospermum circinale CS-537/03]|uniref:hypothetical protein n=1 Tax=Dolichospermum circinale TaxID=109265 RepID=UPI0012DD5896|nr:hypothetical protein [Dolichospermum circinale]MDB9463357.1 hypothetical protein [Dolichospermum circinale CS-541/04]MDB9480910.1 hypothetical protein [Dolichospermum circinale CS-537/03]MDB9549832.1 hypothetical protein [Dolichospermum circinale CS-1031]